jgi:hypothetical protein
MAPVVTGKGRIDAEQVIRVRDEVQAAAADLSAALLTQIDIGLRDRLSSLDQRRLLAVTAFAVSMLLALTPIGLALTNRRREDTAAGEQDQPVTPAPGPGPVTLAPNPWPADPGPAQWPEPALQPVSGPEHTRWERFGVPQ